MIIDMLEYYNFIKKLNIDIIYSGPLWAEGVEGIGETLKKRLAVDELTLSVSQSIFSVFVEQVNNMLMYSADKDTFFAHSENKKVDASKGVFILGTKGRTYFVQSGNIMSNHNIDLIKSRIDHLNTLDKAELRKYYKEQMKKTDINSESRGAGLGFIEIARRASSKIEYKFTPLEDGHSFFSMFVSIG